MLSPTQVKDLAKTVAMISNTIEGFFSDPENEKAYQDWYIRKYGHTEKECIYEQN